MFFEIVHFAPLTLVGLLLLILAIPLAIYRYVNSLSEQRLLRFVLTNRFSALVIGLSFLFAATLISSSTYLLSIEKKETLADAQADLISVRDGVETSLNAWIRERHSYLDSLSESQQLTTVVDQLLRLEPTSEKLLNADAQAQIRGFFARRLDDFGDLGFFVISPNGTNLASMRNENIGRENLIKQLRPDLFRKALAGESQFIPPIRSDVALTTTVDDAQHLQNLSMFFLSPLINAQGETIALISQRLDPASRLSEILLLGRVGSSGESYLIDGLGHMLTKSRFSSDHITDRIDEQGYFTLRTPQSDSGAEGELTVMAKQMIKAAQEYSLTDPPFRFTIGDAYADYRGIPVHGVGLWLPSLQVGIASEIDESEVLKLFNQTSRNFGTSLFLALILTIVLSTFTLVISSRSSRVLQRTADELEERVVERTNRLSNIIENAAEGILVIGSDGKIREFNPSAERIFGYSKEEILGQELLTLMPNSATGVSDSHPETRITPEETLELNSIHETHGRHKTGRLFEMELSFAASELDGEVVYTGLVRDISERKQTERALVNAKIEAEQATKTKSEFLANMSHEIRTPMNAIIGMSELALQMPLESKQRRYIQKVNHAAESLLGIINDILDFSKIEAGKLTLEHRQFALDDILDEIADVIGMQAEEKGIELLFDVQENTHTHYVGDALRIKQILLNLGSNAVKFTSKGEVVFSLACEPLDDGKALLKISVRDTGIGMTPEESARLFQSFSQADNSITRKHGGTGLGLVICRSLTELMNGEINLTSEPGKGTQVNLALTLELAPDVETSNSVPEFIGLNALVVDDNPTASRIVKSLLERLHIQASATSSATEALEYINHTQDNGLQYDLIFVDWRMPEIDGLEFIRMLNDTTDPSSRPQIFLLSAANPDDAVEAAGDLAIEGILQKPLNPSRLYDSLAQAFKMHPSRYNSDHPRRHLDQQLYARRALAGSHLLVVEDNSVNQEITLELLDKVGVTAEIANDGAEALKLAESGVFDGVLMDIQMPVMDGYTATRHLRQSEKYAKVPIIAMTANVMESDRIKALSAGMNDHISKPIDIQAMYATLMRWIEPQQPKNLDDAFSATDLPVIPAMIGIDTATALERLGGSSETYLRILQRFAQSQTEFAQQLNQALDAKDTELAIRLTHTLKGLAGSIGASQLTSLAAEAQSQLKSSSVDETTKSALIHELQQTVETLESTLTSLNPTNQSARLSQDELIERLDELDTLLNNSDSEASELFQMISASTPTELKTDHMAALREMINQYDYSGASEQLALIMNELRAKL